MVSCIEEHIFEEKKMLEAFWFIVISYLFFIIWRRFWEWNNAMQ